MKKASVPWAPVLLCASVSVLGCSRAPAPAAQSDAPPPVATAVALGGARSAAPRSLTLPIDGRLVISEAELSLRTASPESEAEQVSRLVADRGGFVVSKEADRSEVTVLRIHMIVRVPSAQFESTLGELRRHGTVLRESETGRDVTEEYTDTDAELRAKRKVEERLLGIVEVSKTVKEMLEVEGELGRVRSDIEKLEGHTRLLANRASMATVDLSLVSPSQPVPADDESVRSKLTNAVKQAGSVFLSVTTGLIVALGALTPALVPVGLFLALRKRRRRLVGPAMEG